MRARKYNKQIEIWQTTKVSDGFGGNVVTPELITKSRCKIITNNKIYQNKEFGLSETTNKIVVQLRKRNDITYNSKNQFVKYRGEKYVINSEPVNVGFEDREIQITLTKEPTYGVEQLEPIGNQNQNQNQNQGG
jgi:hypothetical protein